MIPECPHCYGRRTGGSRSRRWRPGPTMSCVGCGILTAWFTAPESEAPLLAACGHEIGPAPHPADLPGIHLGQIGRALRPDTWYRARCVVDGTLAGIARARTDAQGAAHFALPRPASGRHYRWEIVPETGGEAPLVFELEALEDDDDGEL